MTTSRLNRADRVTFSRVTRSEWIKFHSLRSSWWSIGLAVFCTVAFGFVFAHGFSSVADDPDLADSLLGDGPGLGMGAVVSTMAIQLAQLAIIALGALTVTGEYSTGMIRSTLSAVPTRLPVLWAKVMIVAAVAFLTGVAGSFGAFVVTHPVLAGSGLESDLMDPEVLRMLVGAGLYLAGIGVLSVALGAILRSAASAIGTAFGLVFVLPVLVSLIPGEWPQSLVPYFPGEAGKRMMQEVHEAATLGPWEGLAVLFVWAAAALVIGAALLRSKDA